MHLILKKVISLVILICLFLPLFSNNKQILQNIVKNYQNAQTFSCKIEQVNTFPAQKKTLTSKGILIKDNLLYLIEFTSPTLQFIKFDESEISIYDSQNKTAHIISKKSFPSFNPETLFSEIEKGNFTLEKLKDSYLISIESFKKQIDTFEFIISPNQDYIKNIKYKDKMGNEVNLILSKPEINKKLKYDLKTYTYPKGTKILKQ